MDPSGTLLALDEQKRWRERRRRIEGRLVRLRARKRALLRKLEVVKRTIADLRSRMTVAPRASAIPLDIPSTRPGVIR